MINKHGIRQELIWPGEMFKECELNHKYILSSKGRVYSYRKKDFMETNGRTTSGYVRISLSISGKVVRGRLHRMIAKAFVPRVEGKNDVNHKDGDKMNNMADNLEWVTKKENIEHAILHGLIPGTVFDNMDVGLVMDCFVRGCSFNEITSKTGYSRASIYKLVKFNKHKYPDPIYKLEEGWLPIKSHYGFYEINYLGQVRNVHIDFQNGGRFNKIIKPTKHRGGLYYSLKYGDKKRKIYVSLINTKDSADKLACKDTGVC